MLPRLEVLLFPLLCVCEALRRDLLDSLIARCHAISEIKGTPQMQPRFDFSPGVIDTDSAIAGISTTVSQYRLSIDSFYRAICLEVGTFKYIAIRPVRVDF